jgi:DNA-binding response OmpR family regulator
MPRILVVDDDPDILLLVETMLKGNHEIRVIDDPQSVTAEDWAWPDLIVVDYSMPHENGAALATRLGPDRPLVFLTAFSAHAAAVEEVRRIPGTRDVLPKPFSPRAFVDRLEALLAEPTA